MNWIYKILICLLISCPVTSLMGQNNNLKYWDIISQSNELIEEEKSDEALKLMVDHEILFQIDDFSRFVYSWYIGQILYFGNRYSEARPYIINAVSFLETNKVEVLQNENISYFVVFYEAPIIDFTLGLENRDDVIRRLEYAKLLYESVDATSNQAYQWLTNDLSNIISAGFRAEAITLYFAQEYEKAIPSFLKDLDYRKEEMPTDYVDLSRCMMLLGTCYMHIGDYKNSEEQFISALYLLELGNLQNEKIYRIILDSMAMLYVELCNYYKAKEYNNRAKIIFERELDFGDNYVRCLFNGALIQSEIGNNMTAKIMIDTALEQAKYNLYDTTSIPSDVEVLNLFLDKQNENTSLDADYFISKKIVPYTTMLSSASAIYSYLGYYSEAESIINECIELSEQYGLKAAMPFNNMGGLYYLQSKFAKAVEWFYKSYALCRAPSEINEVGINTAWSLFLSNDQSTSEFCAEFSERMRHNIQDLFAFMSGEERAIYWKHFEYYLPMVNLFIYESGKSEHYGIIYDNILESKSLLLRYTNEIRDAIFDSENEADRNDYTRFCKLKRQLLTENEESNRNAITKEIEEIDKRLTIHINAYADFAASNNIQWQNVRDALSYKDIAIEFCNIPIVWGLDSVQTMDGEPRYCALVLKKGYGNPHIIPLCKESELENLDREDWYESDVIYNLIWKPLAEELSGVKDIYFSVDRELHMIGIEYAQMSDGGYMTDKYNLHRLSTTRVLTEKQSERASVKAVLYGGLRYDLNKDDLITESRTGDYHPVSASRTFSIENSRYGVKYLSGTLKEVTKISEYFENSPLILTGISATEESFKSLEGKDIDIIHLATHGFFWKEEDAEKRNYVTFLNRLNYNDHSTPEDKALMRSGLLFSGANIGLKGEMLPDDVEDGVLTALEISNMNLGHVDMVVMSACESGLGETSGEGVFGLQRGFKLAGANSILMSLWDVDDEATQMLMTEFYKNYLGGMSKQKSLNEAQRIVRETPGFEDPEYWAAFILLDALN